MLVDKSAPSTSTGGRVLGMAFGRAYAGPRCFSEASNLRETLCLIVRLRRQVLQDNLSSRRGEQRNGMCRVAYLSCHSADVIYFAGFLSCLGEFDLVGWFRRYAGNLLAPHSYQFTQLLLRIFCDICLLLSRLCIHRTNYDGRLYPGADTQEDTVLMSWTRSGRSASHSQFAIRLHMRQCVDCTVSIFE
jgi:hypothetical protein